MKKIAAILLFFAMSLTSCTFACNTLCDGTDAVKGVVADGLSFFPILGPVATQITDLCFDAACTAFCLPEDLTKSWNDNIGINLDPTTAPTVTDDTPTEDPGS